MSAFLTKAILLLNREAFNLPLATSLYTYWRVHPISTAAFENVRYSWHCKSMIGSMPLVKSCCLFFLIRFVSDWHSSEQYFYIPLRDTNALPQNSHFLIGLILFDIAMFYIIWVFHRGSKRKWTIDNSCQQSPRSYAFCISASNLSSVVTTCKPMSTMFTAWQNKSSANSPL